MFAVYNPLSYFSIRSFYLFSIICLLVVSSSLPLRRAEASLSSVEEQGGWRMDRFNPSRTNTTPVAGPATLPTFQVISSNTQGTLLRIGVDGSLVLTDSSNVYCYTNAGQPKWSRSTSGIADVGIGPTGSVYVLGNNPVSVTALNQDTGQEIWTSPFMVDNVYYAAPLAIGSDGTIYTMTGWVPPENVPKLIAINSDGSLKWASSPTALTNTRFVLSTDESAIYVTSSKSTPSGNIGDVVRVSAATGQAIGNTPCDPRNGIYAYAPWGQLYTGQAYNNLFAFSPNLQDCSYIGTGDTTLSIVAITNSEQIVLQVFGGSFGDSMAAISRQGDTLWSKTEPLSRGFADGSGVLYAIAGIPNSGEDKTLVAIDVDTGQELWRQEFPNPVSSVLLGGDSALYLTSGGNIYKGVATSTPTNQPPTAGFAMTNGSRSSTEGQSLHILSSTSPVQVNFSADRSSDADGTVTGWEWKIDGNSVSSNSSFSLDLAYGSYSVQLIVTDNEGTRSQPVTGLVFVTRPAPQPTPIPLNIVAPPQRQQTGKIPKLSGNSLRGGLYDIATDEREFFEGNRFGDWCYFGAVDAAAVTLNQDIINVGLKELSGRLLAISVGAIPTSTAFEAFLVKSGSFLLKASTSDDPNGEAIKFGAEQTAGYLFPNAVGQYLAGSTAGALTQKFFQDVLSTDEITMVEASGTNSVSQFRVNGGAPLTQANIRILYSKKTGFVVARIAAQCQATGGLTQPQSRVFIFRYEADRAGLPYRQAPIEILQVPSK